MLKLLADENLNNDILRALRRRLPDLDVVRVQDVGLHEADDPAVLEWAAREGCVIVTHDVTTMTQCTYDRIRRGQSMPGLFLVHSNAILRPIIDDLALLTECSLEGEWEGQVRYLTL